MSSGVDTFNCLDISINSICRNLFIRTNEQKEELTEQLNNEIDKEIISDISANRPIVKGKRMILSDELENIYTKGNYEGWYMSDDKPAKAIIEESYNKAKSFIQLLDDSISLPTILADDDGTIVFQWDRENVISTISFLESNKFIYCIINNDLEEEESGMKEYIPTDVKGFIQKIKEAGF